MLKGLHAKVQKLDDFQWEDVSDDLLTRSVGGIPDPGQARSEDNERAVLDPNWEASPSALIRMLAWKQQRQRR